MPGFRARPAVSTTTSAPASASSAVEPVYPGAEPEDRSRFLDVERLALGQAVHDIDQDDLPREVHFREALCERSADIPGPEYGDLSQTGHGHPWHEVHPASAFSLSVATTASEPPAGAKG